MRCKMIGMDYREDASVFSSRVAPIFVGTGLVYEDPYCLGEESRLSQIRHVICGDMRT